MASCHLAVQDIDGGPKYNRARALEFQPATV